MSNLTLSVDDKATERARENAQAMGMSLNQFLRNQIDRLAGADQRAREADEYLATSGRGNSRGWQFRRDDLQREVGRS